MQRFLLSFPILVSVLLSGCGVGDYLGAYFNTYYNAKKLFSEAETEILAAPVQTIGLRKEPEFLAPYNVPSQTKTKFTAVIEKCSKLLQYHPESSLVDDALLMIGKSYYYQNEHQSAERKFTEIISNHPESDLVLEARLLLAQTYYRANNREESLTAARELLEIAREQDDDAIRSRTATLLAQMALQRQNQEEAERYFIEAAEYADTPQEKAATYRSLARIFSGQADYRAASDAYVRSRKASSNYVEEYQGYIGEARMLSKLAKYEESLSLLDDLAKNTNFKEFFGEIDFEIGNVYREMGDYEAAVEQYRYVDTAYTRTAAAANSYYQLGKLYEFHYKNFDSANVAYYKGKLEFQQAEITPELVRRSELMTKYFLFKNEIRRHDSLKTLILTPPDTTQADTLAFADSTAVSDSLQELGEEGSPPPDRTKPVAAQQPAPSAPLPPLDTVQSRLAYNKSELASLFYTGFELTDSARYWYETLLAEHPESRYAPRALFTLGQLYRQDSTISISVTDSLYKELIARFPRSEFSAEARRLLELPPLEKSVDSLAASYRAAETLMQKGEIGTALTLFKNIVRKDTLSPTAAKAQYAVGWIYENVRSNPDSSVASYKMLVQRFPNSQYAAIVRPKLSEVEMARQQKLEEERQRQAARQDSLAQRDSIKASPPTALPGEDGVKKPGEMKQTPVKKDTLIDEIKLPQPQKKEDPEEDPKP